MCRYVGVCVWVCILCRGGSRNSLKGGGGFWARILRRGGGVRVQVRGNFHILTSKKNNNKKHL